MNNDKLALIRIDVTSGLPAEITDGINAFPLIAQKMRDGDKQIGKTFLGQLIQSLKRVDQERFDLRLVAPLAADMFYQRVAALEILDEHTRTFCKAVIGLLFDQFRARGICVFYILDNTLRADRLLALKELAELAGLHVICPQNTSLSELEVEEMIDMHTTLHEHILYVEPDASVNYLDMVRSLAQKTDYVVVYRNLGPTDPSMQLLSLGRDRS